MTLYELVKMDIPTPPKYETGVSFLDKPFNGGFELGQLVTITGEQEAGKTMLLEQILGNVAQGHKCLYFSLEFNKRQARKAFVSRLKKETVNEEALKNIEIVTTDMIEGNLYEVISRIQNAIKGGVKFIGLDSVLMLFIEGLQGEQEATQMFRELQRVTVQNDVLMFVIAQGSKEDNKEGRVSIFGSQKANHFANIMLHLTFDREKNKRGLVVAKNKQEGRYQVQEIFFETDRLIFNGYKLEIENSTDATTEHSKGEVFEKTNTLPNPSDLF